MVNCPNCGSELERIEGVRKIAAQIGDMIDRTKSTGTFEDAVNNDDD